MCTDAWAKSRASDVTRRCAADFAHPKYSEWRLALKWQDVDAAKACPICEFKQTGTWAV
jgi:hypothetical protein